MHITEEEKHRKQILLDASRILNNLSDLDWHDYQEPEELAKLRYALGDVISSLRGVAESIANAHEGAKQEKLRMRRTGWKAHANMGDVIHEWNEGRKWKEENDRKKVLGK